MPPTLPPPLVADALADGNILLAIKLLRDQTGMDLGSAKRQVDHWLHEGAAQTVSAALSRHGSAPASHGGGFRADALPPAAVLAVGQGNPIQAIKLTREHHPGLSLAEAKAMVEDYRDHSLQAGTRPTGGHGGGFRADALPPAAVLAVGQGNPIQAIKLTREHHPGLSLAEAKAMVEDYRDRHPLQVGTRPTVASGDRPGGVWLWGMLALLLAGVAVAWLLRG